MGKSKSRYVAKAVPGEGWRIWNTKMQKFWGGVYPSQPDALIHELNGQKRSDELVALDKSLKRK